MKRKRRQPQEIRKPFKERVTFFRHHPWALYPVIIVLVLVATACITIALLSRNLPSLMDLERAGDPLLVTRIYSADGKVLDELFMQKRIKVPLARIPENLIQATLSYEDRKFYDHWGVNLPRFIYMIFRNVTSMRIQGGASTLTQQLARKIYLNPRKTIIRKLREQLTALQIERTYSKSEILEMYLNQMPLGRGAHGVQAAAQAYFHKNVEELHVHESALLVGLLQLPYGYYTPDNNPEAAVRRRNVVLRSMVMNNYLTEAEFDSVSQLPLSVVDRDQKRNAIAPYFCEYIRQTMQEKYGMQLYTNGLSIYTTLDTRVQAAADSAVQQFMPTFEKSVRARLIRNQAFTQWFNPPLETQAEITAALADSALMDSLMEAKGTVQTALVSLGSTNGHILAMVGGRDFEKSKYNRAVQMARQPGSAFKPIVYTVAIDNGYPPTYELYNQPVVIIQPDGTRWSPPNYDGSTGGLTTLREALKRSLNMVAVRLVQEVVPKERVVAYAKHFGLTTEIHPYDAIALGSDVVIPLELVSAFSVFPNRGVRVEPIAILRVEDKDGNVLEEATPRRREVISEETAYIIADMMSSVLNEDRGTGRSARWKYNFYYPAAAGKTGTTNDHRNAWFVGYTPHITTGVWVGFDDERISLGEGNSGAVAALPIWAPFMRMAHDTLQLPLVEFQMPPGVVRVKICNETKKLASDNCPDIREEVFKRDMAPTDTCQVHQSPRKQQGRRNRIVF